MINLAIDIGNTRVKTAIYRNRSLLRTDTHEKLSGEVLREILYNQNVENIILSSTTAIPGDWKGILEMNGKALILDNLTPLPITLSYLTPETLGRDRIAAAVGAYSLFPSDNCLVIDAGTCITMDLIRGGGRFSGGNISPGIRMRLQAMHTFTGQLPNVAMEPDPGYRDWENWLGRSTSEAIRNGAQLGALLEVKGFIERCKRKFRPLHVLFTGGDADFFVKNMKTKIFVHANLVLDGLNQILLYNVENFEGK